MPEMTAALSIPGPPPSRMLGRYGNMIRFLSDPIGYSTRLFARYGRVSVLVSGTPSHIYSPYPHCAGTVFAYGPEYIHQVTSRHEVYQKYPLALSLYPLEQVTPRTAPLRLFGTGLFGVNGDEHKRHRRLLLPAFHKKRIEAYHDDMVSITRDLLNGWQVDQARDIADEMKRVTLRIVTKTMFGEDIGERAGQIGVMLQDALRLVSSPFTLLLPYDLPGFPYRRLLDIIGVVDAEMRGVMARRERAGADAPDVLSMLIRTRDEDGSALSADELVGHIAVIFVAGHETSANALNWIFFLLSQHPRVAADLMDELSSVLGGDPPTVDQLSALPFLDAVIKESLRILPPVPWNARVTAQEDELGGHSIPPGTEVFVSIYQTHHMPDLFRDPEHFDPYRWQRIDPSIYEYNPFSAGPRMCIGAGFAMMELRIITAMVLQRYWLELLPNARVDRSGFFVITPKRGMPMRVRAQRRTFTRGEGTVRGTIREMVELPA